ncbi:MAG: 4-hydroxythreonine-4-phosphate dehydrogenase PdxA [Nitrospinaceae bacterium]|nr:4-hydroxythreonine-4-phosphate dehydrogenase PdxA [Nitrospinaceae bacterium]NIR54066.1 4-hydroxythreonine-4-phosphate dehydrogenase PdxA [Nitrospinaceae bacterium]NIS84484.1 4-hydroxythreonine-4-phosphate dehydrogenase PdxA [Nitrospinaceae bacterium]NIT81279.1 4-hydroxythreonine-4-phosphate dehydrogenase PdxA [Nitrospinaceae bacterium]NIU43566.1 4-hydroxythreonine-4-phosphate dehydrogenase PdxA [Nitrospinaceae bacterium]
MGDPAGIGPEIIVKAFSDRSLEKVCRPLVVGDARWLKIHADRFSPSLALRPADSLGDTRFEPGVLEVLDRATVPPHLKLGEPSREGGEAAVDCIRTAVTLARDHQVDAITTAPINKESLHLAGYPYPGHTELLAELTGAEQVALMLAGRNLRVVLATTHIPLNQVTSHLTRKSLAGVLQLTHRWLEHHVTPTPRIAVTGLNPHCGDGGIFGREEQDLILPTLDTVRSQGLAVFGPFSADSLFAQRRYENYDAVVTMYHDQGMIPVKMESMGQAVNITLGLPILRTSVDHGTAYDRAGKGTASVESLQTALRTAAALCKPSLASP